MRIFVPLLAALALVAACKESPVDPDPVETSFQFDVRLGDDPWREFSARDQQPAGTSFSARGPWVFTGSSGAPHITLLVNAYQQVAGGWHSLLVYVPNRAGIDSVAIGDVAAGTCPHPGGLPCTQAIFRVESAAGALLESCTVVDGRLAITRRTEDWISGRISGTGRCTAGGLMRDLQIRDGEFHIALPPPAGAPG